MREHDEPVKGPIALDIVVQPGTRNRNVVERTILAPETIIGRVIEEADACGRTGGEGRVGEVEFEFVVALTLRLEVFPKGCWKVCISYIQLSLTEFA